MFSAAFSRYMKRNFWIQTIYFLTIIAAGMLSGCRDEFEYFQGISDEETSVRIAVDFTPAAEGLTTRSSYEGEAIKDIEDLCLMIFDTDDNDGGSFYDMIHVPMSTVTITDHERSDSDASNGQLAGEVITKRAVFDCKLPVGTYYVYVLANMHKYDKESGKVETTEDYLKNLINADKDNLTRRRFCEIKRDWDHSDIRNNSELTGYLVVAKESSDGLTSDVPSTDYPYSDNTISATLKNPLDLAGMPVTVKKGANTLHCWLRRMASKVTVTFDAKDLSDNISVYIQDIRLHDIPSSAPLLTAGVVTEESELTDDSQCLAFYNEENYDVNAAWTSKIEKLPELTKANWTLGPDDSNDDYINFPNLKKLTHSNDAHALFFYENMQGIGESKLQDVDGGPDGVVDSPESGNPENDHYKDNKRLGTYVEVRGYYVNRIKGEESHGPIIYRFMLGKDEKTDYNCERNYHYKLTLQLKGRANEVDWHIDYEVNEESVDIPSPYYISYGYNESLDLPIKVKGRVTSVEATIIQNNWFPTQINDKEQIIPTEWKDHVTTTDAYSGLRGPDGYGNVAATVEIEGKKVDISGMSSLGFLSLIKPKGDAIAAHLPAFNSWNSSEQQQYLKNYYFKGEGTPEEKREAKTYTRKFVLPPESSSKTITDEDIGGWSYTRYTNGGKDYTQLYIPLYTRQRNLAKTSGHSGQNPFVSYQRNARVHYKITLEDGKSYERTIDVIQVPRIANPTGIWRAWNNSRSFHVSLNMLDGDDNDTYKTLESYGPWSAEVIVGQDWILLNGKRQKIYGNRGSKVEFDYRPAGVLKSEDAAPRFGIIEVRYHNYSCVHKIFVRQGYKPVQINPGDAYWHTTNLVSKDSEGITPMDEGSMFRFGNLDQAIASSNNYNDKNPWINVTPTDFLSHENMDFVLSDGSKTKWNKITSKAAGNDGNRGKFLEVNKVRLSGATKDSRIMTFEDIKNLRDKNSFAFGILYGDEASSTLFNVNEAYGYKAYLSHQQYGMRGCFVYNKETGAQIFFPIGSTGFGRRMNQSFHDINGRRAVLKYSTSGKVNSLSANTLYARCMMLYTLYKSPGAFYWFYTIGTCRVGGEKGPDCNHDDVDHDAIALDLNYFSYDFNPLPSTNAYTPSENPLTAGDSDACFIRLVQDEAP